jgi:hypothetical protein
MSLSGKRDGFQTEDLINFSQTAGIKKPRSMALLGEVSGSLQNWPRCAAAAGVSGRDTDRIAKAFRKSLFA